MKNVLLCMGVACLLLGGAARAEDSARAENPALSAEVIAQTNLANKLIALGDARRDPLLLIAAAKVQKSLGSNSEQEAGAHELDTRSILERARAYANGQSDLIGLIDDVAAMKSKGFEFNPKAGQLRFTF